MAEVTIEDVIEDARIFLSENYNMQLRIPIRRNNRLKKTFGQFIHMDNIPDCIELSGILLDYGGKAAVLDTLHHELIHYALFELGKPYRDGDLEFESELRKYSVSPTNTSECYGPIVRFVCAECGKSAFTTTKRVGSNPQRYRTKCCKADLINVRNDVIYGEYKEAE
ncbi:SprT-like domain-containing protein [Bacillus subtilis]